MQILTKLEYRWLYTFFGMSVKKTGIIGIHLRCFQREPTTERIRIAHSIFELRRV